MNLAYTLSNGGPLVKKYKIAATVGYAGIPLLDASTATAGVRNATTTSLANCIGLGLDTATYTTTQSASMVEGVVSVVINPDAVIKARMSGSATEGTQLGVTTNSSASAGGTVVTITSGDAAPNSPSMVDGTAIALSGNNVNLLRTISSVAATTATVTVPFPLAIAVNDTFVLIPWSPAHASAITAILTTNLYEVRGDSDSTGDAAINCVDLQIDSALPRTNSFLHFLFRDHVLKDST